jgi:hypothetical protein
MGKIFSGSNRTTGMVVERPSSNLVTHLLNGCDRTKVRRGIKEKCKCLYLVLVHGEWIVPLDEIPVGHPFVVTLCTVILTILVLIGFHHVDTAIFGRKWYEDSATQHKGAVEVLANATVLLVTKVLFRLDF